MSSAEQLLAKIPAREWRGLVPKWHGGRLNFALVCDTCGGTDHWSAARMIGPQTAVPKIIQLGWDVNGKLTCPGCISPRKKPVLKLIGKDDMEKPEVKRHEGWRDVAEKALNDTNFEAVRKNKRLVIAALEDYFDDVTGSYRNGKSDKAIAAELDLAEGFVQATRDELFGPIKPPSEVQALMTEAAGMQEGLDNLKKRIEALITKQGWKA